MLTQTSEMAIRMVVFLARRKGPAPVPPREIAARLGISPSYAAKVTGALAKGGILRAHRGPQGGVTLSKGAEDVVLLEVVEACQGVILGDYCQDCDEPKLVCAYHKAMLELHEAVVSVLRRWSIADLAAKPAPSPPLLGKVPCRMVGAAEPMQRAATEANVDGIRAQK